MVDPERVRVWSARLAAPVAFFLAATVLVVLVQRALDAGAEDTVATTPVTTGTGTATTTPDGTTTNSPRRCPRRYRVREGDTLESIAERCGTDVATLLDLNPRIDPLALTPGQRLRTR